MRAGSTRRVHALPDYHFGRATRSTRFGSACLQHARRVNYRIRDKAAGSDTNPVIVAMARYLARYQVTARISCERSTTHNVAMTMQEQAATDFTRACQGPGRSASEIIKHHTAAANAI